MHFSKKNNGLVVMTTTVCLLCSQVLVSAAQPLPTSPATPRKDVVIDVQLGTDASLSGLVVDARNRPRVATVVTVLQGRRIVARGSTDDRGRFAITGMSGGLYQLNIEGTQRTCRAWVSGTAPRSAVVETRIVVNRPVVRGQESPVVRGQDGLFGDPAISTGVTTALIVGGIIGAMFLIAELDENDDAPAPASP